MTSNKDIKGDIYLRLRILRIVLLFVAGLIVFSIFRVQKVEGIASHEELQKRFRTDTLEAARGPILSADGTILASSHSFFDIYWDLNVPSLTDDQFKKGVPELAQRLAEFSGKSSSAELLANFKAARAANHHYFPIAKRVNYWQLEEMKSWPIFEWGQLKGGFIAEDFEDRVMPMKGRGSRAVGHTRKDPETQALHRVGLEEAYDEYLKGTESICRTRLVGMQGRLPVSYIVSAERQGMELHSTIDTRLQDYTSSALKKTLERSEAQYGCAVVMEVKTGAIRAMANLGRSEDGAYYEDWNYAIDKRTYPGSTFKLATLLALLKSNKVTLNKAVSTEGGKKKYYKNWMKDDHPIKKGENDVFTVKRIMEVSSNVGISKLATEAFSNDPREFMQELRQMGLMDVTGIALSGERMPKFPVPNQGQWSGLSLPWLSIGYEAQLTPLQMLSLYASVANEGKRMRPYLVDRITQDEELIVDFSPEQLGEVCSPELAKKVQQVLRGVVDGGTARGIKSEFLSMAGKTGTAQLIKAKGDKPAKHQASFVGSFPADEPVFACIVVVNTPRNGQIYGAELAAPVFKEIALGAYALFPDWHKEPQFEQQNIQVPSINKGQLNDVQLVLQELGIPSYGGGIDNKYEDRTNDKKANPFVAVRSDEVGAKLLVEGNTDEAEIPNVKGFGLRDAVFMLESRGWKVSFQGKGKVKTQSVKPGTKLPKGEQIKLELT